MSIDGPKEIHDRYRVDKRDRSTFDKVMAGIKLLQRHSVEFNTLTVLHRENVTQPHAVYDFLKGIGSTFLQFIPLVERQSGTGLVEPPFGRTSLVGADVMPWSVVPKDFGEFLVAVFREWVRKDVGRTFVQLFDVALSNWMGLGSPLCLFAETAGAPSPSSTMGTSIRATTTSIPATGSETSSTRTLPAWSQARSSRNSERPRATPCPAIANAATCGSRATASAPRTAS